VFLADGGLPYVYVGVSDTTLAPTDTSPLLRDTWLCFELHLDLQTGSGTATLEVDGVEAISGGEFTTQPTEPFSVAVIEAQPTSDTTGVDLYIDDLVVATSPIGCE
jgi:hypothetical protein